MSRASTLAAAAISAAAVFVLGCSRASDSPEGGAPKGGSSIVHTYTVRGEVAMLPTPERPLNEFQIRHEHIPNYADRDGNVFVSSRGVRGMGSMTMAFPLADGVSLEGLQVGDKLEFTFETTWGEKYPTYQIVELSTLPDETELDFTTMPGPVPEDG